MPGRSHEVSRVSVMGKTPEWLQGRGNSLKWYCCWELSSVMVMAVMTLIFSQEGDVMLPLKNLMGQKEGREKIKVFLFVTCDPCSVEKKGCFLTGVCSCHTGNRLHTTSQFSIPCVFHKALKQQKSFLSAADRSSIQVDGCAVNVRCQGTCKHFSPDPCQFQPV